MTGGFLLKAALCVLTAAQLVTTSADTVAERVKHTGTMAITSINYGNGPMSGDAILVSSGEDKLLMDTGYTDTEWDLTQSTVIRWLKEKGIDRLDLYVSHWHNDHYGLMTTIMQDDFFHIEKIYLPESSEELQYADPSNAGETWYENLLWNIGDPERSRTTHSYHEILEVAEARGIEVVWLDEGSVFRIGDARAEVLWHRMKNYPAGETVVPYLNDRSLVTMITCGGVRYLTCGDMHSQNEQAILEAGIDVHADIFKASHHADATSNCDAWMQAVAPSYIISTRQKISASTLQPADAGGLQPSGDSADYLDDIDESRNEEERLSHYGQLLNAQLTGTFTIRAENGVITVDQ